MQLCKDVMDVRLVEIRPFYVMYSTSPSVRLPRRNEFVAQTVSHRAEDEMRLRRSHTRSIQDQFKGDFNFTRNAKIKRRCAAMCDTIV